MTSFFLTLLRFMRAFGQALKDAEFRALFVILVALLASGTIFYSKIEGWSLLDSLYFSVITLATVGYGDLHPTTPLSKVFTMVYLVLGMGVFVAFITKLTSKETERKKRRNKRDDGAQ